MDEQGQPGEAGLSNELRLVLARGFGASRLQPRAGPARNAGGSVLVVVAVVAGSLEELGLVER